MELVVAADDLTLAVLAAEPIAAALRAAVARRGRASLAVSGGDSPGEMFAVLAAAGLDWSRIDVFQVDERVAPDGHADRNAELLRRKLVEAAPVPPGRVHLMPVTAFDLDAAAAGYAALLADVTGDGVLDVVHLGLGEDGHTASWPPGDPVGDIDRGPDVAVVGPFNGRLRMTLTPPAVNRSRLIVWLIDGATKEPAVSRLLADDRSIPASRVRTERAVAIVGRDAFLEDGHAGMSAS